MEEAKITSVEKVKDPKRVEAGKRLAAMSKQAKEKKAVERLSQETFVNEFQISEISSLAIVGVVGFVGTVVYYKYFSKTKSDAIIEMPESKTLDSPKEERSEKPKRRELDTLD